MLTTFGTSQSRSFGGTHRELVPNNRLRHTDTFHDPGLPGEMHTTEFLKKLSGGTDISIVQQGIFGAIHPDDDRAVVGIVNAVSDLYPDRKTRAERTLRSMSPR